MSELKGLCLASTAIQHPKRLFWLHRPTHHGSLKAALGTLTRYPFLPRCAEQETSKSTKNVLPERGFSLRTPSVQLERFRVGEPSLSRERECLSLPLYSRTNVAKKQEGGAFSPDVHIRRESAALGEQYGIERFALAANSTTISCAGYAENSSDRAIFSEPKW